MRKLIFISVLCLFLIAGSPIGDDTPTPAETNMATATATVLQTATVTPSPTICTYPVGDDTCPEDPVTGITLHRFTAQSSSSEGFWVVVGALTGAVVAFLRKKGKKMNDKKNILAEIDAIDNLGVPLEPAANVIRHPKLALMQVDLLARRRALLWVLGKDPRTVNDLYADTVELARKKGLI